MSAFFLVFKGYIYIYIYLSKRVCREGHFTHRRLVALICENGEKRMKLFQYVIFHSFCRTRMTLRGIVIRFYLIPNSKPLGGGK